MTRLIASFTIRACSASPTSVDGRPDREQDRLGALDSALLGPETMKVRFPARTTLGLPLTGART